MSTALYEIKYDEVNESIIEIAPNGKTEVISDEFPSRPIISPNNLYSSYIAPLEWEVPGNLYVYDLKNGENRVCIEPDSHGNTPKFVQWLNNEVLLVLIGFAHGTVSIGGNLFKYHIIKDELTQITDYPSEIQVTKIKLTDDFVILSGIKYIDDILNEFESFEEKIDITTL